MTRCAEISIVLCYFQLCNEDYNWWWRAFLNPGASGIYLFGYAFVYFSTQLKMVRFVLLVNLIRKPQPRSPDF